MAKSCKEQLVKVEEEVLQPVDTWVKEQQERCEEEECKWWMLCLNQLVCWLVWVTVKVIEWVLIVVVRWVYRLVCIAVSLFVGVLALIFTFNSDILIQAFKDLFELFEDTVFFVLGFVLLYGNDAIDFILTKLRLKDEKRNLTDNEIAVLKPIFGDSLLYNLVRVNEGRLGIMGPPFATGGATTIGYNIYYRDSPPIDSVTLVHECVHVWQFQFGGTQYVGQSAIFQLIDKFSGSDTYDWFAVIGTSTDAWYLLKSVEAQAEFVMDVYTDGTFIFSSGTVDNSNGAFFQTGKGNNEFKFNSVDFTDIANSAWTILKTG